MGERLDSYRERRDFSSTAEPRGGEGSAAAGGSRFVVQEHHATRLHWDLRLERDGVLASWAVPAGIPDDPKRNRKAVRTEDHPLEYLDFAGEIPAGSYGAGTMSIWDSGTYECEKWEPRKVTVTFRGSRLRGRYALFQTGSDRDWMIHRMDPPADPGGQPMPERVVPMLASTGDLPADESAWAYEIKWDGVRALAYSEPGRLRLESRNLNDITARYPEIRALNGALGSRAAVLDGEIVAFDEGGRPSFERLQRRMHLTGEAAARRAASEVPVAYVIFDLLHLDGRDLVEEPYEERRSLLHELGLDGPSWRTPEHHVGDGGALLAASRERGLEGVVAKRLGSLYRPARRSGDWLKVKHTRRQEVVIGGWTPGRGRRGDGIGALLVGHYEPSGPGGGPTLRYAGRVGTGFGDAELRRLEGLLADLERASSPFGRGRPPKGATWVEPRQVAEVEFAEWTREGLLRQPSYKGLRDDRDPRGVVREETAPGGGEPPAVLATVSDRRERTEPAAGEGLEELIAAGGARRGRGAELTVEEHALKLSNLDKVLYPEAAVTKADVIDYYVRVAPVLLPHLRGRPLTLKRYPDGVEGGHFYEKRCPGHRPEWVRTASVWSRHNQATIEFCLAEDLPTLIWAANLANLELHTSLSLGEEIERPTVVAFDLDPGPPAGLVECSRVALRLRAMFDQLDLECFAKTSGSKGLQVYLPLNSETSYAETKPFARGVAETLEGSYPDLVVSRMAKALRPGKVLVDWSQNDEHKTTVNVYSLRARERPTVSAPLRWEEVEAAERGEPDLLTFDAADVLARIDRYGDLFAGALSGRQSLPRFT